MLRDPSEVSTRFHPSPSIAWCSPVPSTQICHFDDFWPRNTGSIRANDRESDDICCGFHHVMYRFYAFEEPEVIFLHTSSNIILSMTAKSGKRMRQPRSDRQSMHAMMLELTLFSKGAQKEEAGRRRLSRRCRTSSDWNRALSTESGRRSF